MSATALIGSLNIIDSSAGPALNISKGPGTWTLVDGDLVHQTGHLYFHDGSTTYDLLNPGGSTSANNGLSVHSGAAVLGQDLGDGSNTGKLLSSRYVPMNGFGLYFLGSDIKAGFETAGNLFYGGPESVDGPVYAIYQPNNYGTTYAGYGKAMRFESSWDVVNGVNPSGRPNVVGNFWAYNANAGGGRIDTNEAAFRFGTESHYELGGGNGSFELHLPEITFTDGTMSRIWSWYIYKGTATSVILNAFANQWNFFTNPLNQDASINFNNEVFNFTFSEYHTTGEHGSVVQGNNPAGNGFALQFKDDGLTIDTTTDNPFNRHYSMPGGGLSITTDNSHIGTGYVLELNVDYGLPYGVHLNQSTSQAGAFYPFRADTISGSSYAVLSDTYASSGQETGWLLFSGSGKTNIRHYGASGHYYDYGLNENVKSQTYIALDGVPFIYFNGANKSIVMSSHTPTTTEDGEIWLDGSTLKIQVGGVVKTFTLI
jgi:hypothetical protein